jgi:hypothetical protein
VVMMKRCSDMGDVVVELSVGGDLVVVSDQFKDLLNTSIN